VFKLNTILLPNANGQVIMRNIFLVVALFLLGFSTLAQESERLTQLNQDRDRLYNEWKAASNESSGLFGGRSKDDLNVEIEILKKLMAKDEEILKETQRMDLSQLQDLKNQYNDLNQQYNDLLGEKDNLSGRLNEQKQFSKDNRSAQQLGESRQLLYLSCTIAFGVLCIWLFLNNLNLKKQLKKIQNPGSIT
jgi:hypothetical protein